MDVDTYDALNKILLHLKAKSKKDNGFGKTCQILLAITFCRLGFQVENYSSQGVDIDIWNHSQYPNFSVEVKTTIKDTVQLGEKDVEGLKKKEDEGYKIAFAVLPINSLSGWLIVNAKGIIKSSNIPLNRLNNKTRVLPDLQKEVNQVFPKVISDYEPEILRRVSDEVLMYLDKNLEKEKEKRNAALRDEEDEKVYLTKNQFFISDNASQFL